LNFPGGLPPSGPRRTNINVVQRGASAGGGYCTVEDLLRFAEALQGHKLLNKEYTDLDMTGHVATQRENVKYALGMEEQFVNGVRIVGHGGGGPGINGNLDMYPEEGYVVAVLSNYGDGANLINLRIRMWLTGQEAPQAIHLPADALKSFAGTYTVALPSGGPPGRTGGPQGAGNMKPPQMEITSDPDGLWLASGTRHRLLPLSPTEFFDDNAPELHFTFTKDPDGHITGFTMPGPGGRPMTATKAS
jgi:hypothetical protein